MKNNRRYVSYSLPVVEQSGTSRALLVPRRAKDSTFIVGKFRGNGSCVPLTCRRKSTEITSWSIIERESAILAREGKGKKWAGEGNIIPPSQIEKAVQDVHGSSIVRGRDRFPNSRITRMNEQNQDNTEDSVQQGGEYKVHQCSDGDHPVHPRVQTRRAWKLSVKNLIPFHSIHPRFLFLFFFFNPQFIHPLSPPVQRYIKLRIITRYKAGNHQW